MTQSIKKISGVGSIAFAVLMLLALPLSFAKADDGGDYSADYSYPDSGASYDYSYPDATTGASYDYSYPDATTGASYDYSYPDATTGSSYDYSYPDSASSGYTGGGYTSGGYTSGGYTSGGYASGGYASGGYPSGYSYPVATTPSNTNIYAPTNTSICSNGNNQCNTTTTITTPAPVINNNNVVVPSAPIAQPVVYQQPVPVYNPPVQIPVYQQPLAYNTTPYVSLTQVPYTGLDLGFWGSIAYWGAFVLFALFAAYLIAVKRVQNNIANSMKAFLFGSTIETTEEVATPATTDVVVELPAQPGTVAAHVVAAEVTNGDVIDSFIMSQINRARHA